jgi:hypothetical protein
MTLRFVRKQIQGIIMKVKTLSVAAAIVLSQSAMAADVQDGIPKTGLFMYANTVTIDKQRIALPVLKSGKLICTTYIASSEVIEGEVKVKFGQYCDPVSEKTKKLEDGSKARVISSASVGTFTFNQRLGKHQFVEPEDQDALDDVYHVTLADEVYKSFAKGFENKVEEFIQQRDEALKKMKKTK